MAVRGKSSSPDRPPVSAEVRALDRIGRLLAMIATKGLTQKDQILFLRGAGFDVQEIADIAGTTPNNVSVALYAARQSRGGRRTGAGKTRKK